MFSPDESKQIWKQVQERWGLIHGSWYPMIGREMPADVVAFEDKWLYQEISLDALKNILNVHGTTEIWELREGQRQVEKMECERLDPYYDGTEGYWTSESLDWLIYASHEHSLTVAGEWLLTAIKALWPHWNEHLYPAYQI